nr:ABC transporter permease [Micromonospora sp. DSM 115978]
MPAPLAALTAGRWYAATVGPEGVFAAGPRPPFTGGPPPMFGLRAQTGVREAARLVAGAWPATAGTPTGTVEIALSRSAAETLLLSVGDQLVISGGPGNNSVPATLVGLFEAIDGSAPVWDDLRLALEPIKPLADSDPYQAMAVTDWTGIDLASQRLGLVTYGWRYQVDPDRLDASQVESVASAVLAARRDGTGGAVLNTSLDGVLARFDAQLSAVRALLAVVQAGLLASLIGLILLAARLAVARRREEFALLRARGAAIGTVGARTLAESALLVPAATVAGWLVGSLLPGRAGGAELPLVVAVGLVATAATPIVVMVGQRGAGTGGRLELARQRLSARRLTAEASVLAVAGLGVFLLHRRGLSESGAVDPYLVSVPVLLAAGTALLALRAVRWPLRQLDRLAARLRGVVAFLGLVRAGRGAPITAGPLAVLVVAISTGVFSAALGTTIADTRDRVSDREIAADALVTGYAFAPATGDKLAVLPGVEAVAAATLESNRRVLSGTGASAELLGQVQVLVVDAVAFARVVEASGTGVAVPAALTGAPRTGGSVPAVVSPKVAELLRAAGDRPGPAGRGDPVVDVQGRLYAFTVGATAGEVPGLRIDVDRFIVLPWQAMPVPDWKPVIPNQFLIAGSGFEAATIRRVADAGQRAHAADVLGTPDAPVPLAAAVTTRPEHRRALERTGANEVLTLTYLIGAVGAAALALLALAFAVVAGAESRGRALSKLRTLGLSRRQGHRLLVYELAPVVGTALVAGGLVGVALPWLLAPSLGLSSFTAGLPVATRIDPAVVAGSLALLVVGLAAALTVENVVNRSARLGEVLRLGEEH